MREHPTADQLPVLQRIDVVAIAAQAMYDKAHDPEQFYCLTDPCVWHPYETRIRPPLTYVFSSAETAEGSSDE